MQITLSRLLPFLNWWPLVNQQSLPADFLTSRIGAFTEVLNKGYFITEIGSEDCFAKYKGTIVARLDSNKCARRPVHASFTRVSRGSRQTALHRHRLQVCQHDH